MAQQVGAVGVRRAGGLGRDRAQRVLEPVRPRGRAPGTVRPPRPASSQPGRDAAAEQQLVAEPQHRAGQRLGVLEHVDGAAPDDGDRCPAGRARARRRSGCRPEPGADPEQLVVVVPVRLAHRPGADPGVLAVQTASTAVASASRRDVRSRWPRRGKLEPGARHLSGGRRRSRTSSAAHSSRQQAPADDVQVHSFDGLHRPELFANVLKRQ